MVLNQHILYSFLQWSTVSVDRSSATVDASTAAATSNAAEAETAPAAAAFEFPIGGQIEGKLSQKAKLTLNLYPTRTGHKCPRMIPFPYNFLVWGQSLQPQM